MSYIEVVFNLPINHAYTYHVSDEFNVKQTGLRVLAPFGKRALTGIVTGLAETTDYTSVKDIIDVLDDKPLISGSMLQLTRWIADYYMCSWGQSLQLALPKGIDTEEKEFVFLTEQEVSEPLSERQNELYQIIGSNPGRSKDYYRKKFGTGYFYSLLNILEEKKLIYREIERENPRVAELFRKFVVISGQYTELKADKDKYLTYIKKRPEIDAYMEKHKSQAVLMTTFLEETAMATATLQKIAGYNLCTIEDRKIERKPDFDFSEITKIFHLSSEQQKIVDEVTLHLSGNEFATYLIHGVTGSGKTQVYIEILRKVLELGKTAIILIPEIALTPQTVYRFESNFPGKIAVFHSKMSPGERYDAWMACFEERITIAVGPRSALFAPLKNPGLIVVDEEHETTYKQSDTTPRYHARDVAIYWANMNSATVALGSATPSLESYYNARRGKFRLHEIRNRVDDVRLPEVHIVDLKQNRKRIDGKVSLFSELLIDKIGDRLGKKEQIILLQNRRGHSSFLQCHQCGYIALCPNCDVTLTYHSFNEKLQCHFCGHIRNAIQNCPNCGGEQIAYKGIGTQRIQTELQALFPKSRILRMDQDTTRGKNSHDLILKKFGSGEADILLGTQMIAKGLDFASVTLVGVISADIGIAQPDFRAPERVFQLLTQVAGRSGRGQLAGEVVIQSYIFSHYSIQYARNHDFLGFYMHEMQHRQNYNYPPFVKIIQILFVAEKLSNAIKNARTMAMNLKKKTSPYCQVIGPAPAVVPRINNLHRWQIMLKLNMKTDPAGRKVKEQLNPLIDNFSREWGKSTKIIVDVDPVLLH